MNIKHVESPRSGHTASGYGSKIPTGYMVQLDGDKRWRRLYAICYSNVATFFVVVTGERVIVRDADIPDAV